MCGITGFIDFKQNSNEFDLQEMTKTLNKRGPDQTGFFFKKKANFNIGLGHTRLSIIDLSNRADQPMAIDNKVMVYNGEVYNYKEIRLELQNYGIKFFSDSDTEVILRAFIQWGTKCVDKFIGMFSIAIFDQKINKVYFFRDRAGVKPLYYCFKDDILLFGSELKAITKNPYFEKKLNIDACGDFFKYGYIPAPQTIYMSVKKLLPGTIIEFDLGDKTKIFKKYWDVSDFYKMPKLKLSYQEALDHFEKIISSSFKYRMVSDVPIGVFLSGGYDSSCVASILAKYNKTKLNTFTIGFEEDGFSEVVNAREIAKHFNTNHHEMICSQNKALDLIYDLPDIYDEPLGDPSAIPTLLLSQFTREHVKVALSGDGGDELMAGYDKYFSNLNVYNLISKLPQAINKIFKPFFGSLSKLRINQNLTIKTRIIEKLLSSKNINDIYKAKINSGHFNSNELDNLFKNNIKILPSSFDQYDSLNSLNSLEKMLCIDYKTYMVDDVLTKVDRATMSASLEGREPLLDHRIIEFVAQLPSDYKYSGRNGKRMLKDLVHKYIPTKLMDRPKMGFGIPIDNWLKNDFKDMVIDLTNEDFLKNQNIFNSKKIINYRDSFFNGRPYGSTEQIWFIMIFQLWYKNWF